MVATWILNALTILCTLSLINGGVSQGFGVSFGSEALKANIVIGDGDGGCVGAPAGVGNFAINLGGRSRFAGDNVCLYVKDTDDGKYHINGTVGDVSFAVGKYGAEVRVTDAWLELHGCVSLI